MLKESRPVKDTPAAAFHARLDSDALGLVAVDSHGFITAVNPALINLVGFEPRDLVERPLRLLFPEIDATGPGVEPGAAVRSAARRRGGNCLEAVTMDGGMVMLEVWAFDSLAGKGELVIGCRDVTRETGLEQALTRQRETLGAIYSQVADGVIIVDSHGFVENINPVAAEMLDQGHRRLDHAHLDEILKLREVTTGEVFKPFAEAMAREQPVNRGEGILLDAGGSPVPVMVSATPVRVNGNDISGAVIVIRAVSESRRISSRLSWSETHDPLTQLANRRQMETEVIRAIDNAHVDNSSHGLLYIDLFNFSMINDICGHAAGDEFLRQLARLIAQTVSENDVVGRTGNDEFAVLVWGRNDGEVNAVAETILDLVVGFTLPWDDRRLRVGASIGVEMIDRASTSEADIMLNARASCALAREAGRNRIHFPTRSGSGEARQVISAIATSIGEALEEDRFVVYFQPIVSLQSRDTVKHYEALVRMVDRDGTIIPPGEFIPAAETSGLIDDIDRWVFEHVLGAIQNLPQARRNRYSFSVNLSGFTISDERFLDHAVRRLRELSLAPGVLQFELTETAAVKHFDQAVHFIKTLNEFGCAFALDDFGSGLSSFGYLRDLPVNSLKIDGSFVRRMEVEHVDYSMVSTINHLAHVMGLATIAEWVENQTQLAILREIGVDYGQGAVFAMPQPLDRILDRG